MLSAWAPRFSSDFIAASLAFAFHISIQCGMSFVYGVPEPRTAFGVDGGEPNGLHLQMDGKREKSGIFFWQLRIFAIEIHNVHTIIQFVGIFVECGEEENACRLYCLLCSTKNVFCYSHSFFPFSLLFHILPNILTAICWYDIIYD